MSDGKISGLSMVRYENVKLLFVSRFKGGCWTIYTATTRLKSGVELKQVEKSGESVAQLNGSNFCYASNLEVDRNGCIRISLLDSNCREVDTNEAKWSGAVELAS